MRYSYNFPQAVNMHMQPNTWFAMQKPIAKDNQEYRLLKVEVAATTEQKQITGNNKISVTYSARICDWFVYTSNVACVLTPPPICSGYIVWFGRFIFPPYSIVYVIFVLLFCCAFFVAFCLRRVLCLSFILSSLSFHYTVVAI